MYSRILVGVDDSETSKLALLEASKLAKDQKAKLRILYVADEYLPVAEGVPIDFAKHEAAILEHGQKILDEMLDLAKKEKIDVESHLVLIEPNVSIPDKIVAEAKKWNADLIMLGTHGRTGLSRLIQGSVAEEVSRIAPVPVQIIRGEE